MNVVNGLAAVWGFILAAVVVIGFTFLASKWPVATFTALIICSVLTFVFMLGATA